MAKSKETIVISGINLRSGGPLTIIRDCLEFLSQSDISKDYRIIALVHRKSLFNFPNIKYVEFPDSVKSWSRRIYYEYFYFNKLSKQWKPYLWLSLHDITPRVVSTRQAVYMHNSIISNRVKCSDWKFDKTYIAFTLLYKYLYRLFVGRNNYCIVQQQWFRQEISKVLGVPLERIVVARPNIEISVPMAEASGSHVCRKYFFPSFPRPFKNFETLCEATKILEQRGVRDIEVNITLNGGETAYSTWIKNKYTDVKSIKFLGILDKEQMLAQYEATDCLVFPSRIESWGLPISEFISYGRPLIVADKPYAHETSEGALQVAYFDISNAEQLADLMQDAYKGVFTKFNEEPRKELVKPFAADYESLFKILLGNDEMLFSRISNKNSFVAKLKQ